MSDKLWFVSAHPPKEKKERKLRVWQYIAMAPTAELAIEMVKQEYHWAGVTCTATEVLGNPCVSWRTLYE